MFGGERSRTIGAGRAGSTFKIKAIRIEASSGDWLDIRFDWLRQREISTMGAVLVRPDRFVAWRSLGTCDNPKAALETALEQVLRIRQTASR